jgi:fatty-acyl-CoA synthase
VESLPPTLPALVDLRAAAPGDALVFPRERASFSELAALSQEMARRLRAAGVRRGDRVGMLMTASVDAYALLVGAMRLGAVPVPVNVRFRALEVSYVVGHSGMSVLVAEPAYAAVLEEARADDACQVVLGAHESAFAAAAEQIPAEDVEREQAAVGGDDDALMLYTSGTTANPKGCVHRHAALVAEGVCFGERLSLRRADRMWTPLPFFHVGGIACLSITLVAGCALLEMGHFEPGQALEQIASERATVAFPAFETIWLAVLNHPRFPEAELGALRAVINVGVPASLRAMQERLPDAPQISCFGSTEMCAFSCVGEVGDTLETRVTTSGRPLRGVEVRAVDPETGRDVPAGDVGELLVRGPTRFVRYHDDPEATATAIDADGWFHSGDLGRFDPEGRVSFVGRLKDMLKVGGENVAAAEVENCLLGHPAVEIAQVVGAPDTRYVEVPAAFVQLRQDAEAGEEELIDFCLGRIATFKVPRYVRVVEEWPMSGTKIQKFKLRERIARELEESGIEAAPKLVSRPAGRDRR